MQRRSKRKDAMARYPHASTSDQTLQRLDPTWNPMAVKFQPLTTALKRVLAEPDEVFPEKTKAQILIEALISYASQGRGDIGKLIFERIEGKMPDSIHVKHAPLDEMEEGKLKEIIGLGTGDARETIQS